MLLGNYQKICFCVCPENIRKSSTKRYLEIQQEGDLKTKIFDAKFWSSMLNWNFLSAGRLKLQYFPWEAYAYFLQQIILKSATTHM